MYILGRWVLKINILSLRYADVSSHSVLLVASFIITHIYTHTNHQILNLAGKDYKIQEKENVTNKKIYVPSITFSIPIKTRKHKPWLLVFYYICNVVTDTINWKYKVGNKWSIFKSGRYHQWKAIINIYGIIIYYLVCGITIKTRLGFLMLPRISRNRNEASVLPLSRFSLLLLASKKKLTSFSFLTICCSYLS